jgi:DNA-binding transcriptional MocR family regulator
MRALDDMSGPGAAGDFDGNDKAMSFDAGDHNAPILAQLGCIVISVSSFTKILAPGLRVGWVEASPCILERLVKRAWVTSGGGVAPLASRIVLEVIRSGELVTNLQYLTTSLAHRCQVLCDALSMVRARMCGCVGVSCVRYLFEACQVLCDASSMLRMCV